VGAKDRTETVDPFELQTQLLELAEVRQSWDELFGRLALLLKGLGLWRDLGFASLSHYAAERLGMAGRTVAQPRRFRLPHSVVELLWTAIEAVREQNGAALTGGECIEVIAEHSPWCEAQATEKQPSAFGPWRSDVPPYTP